MVLDLMAQVAAQEVEGRAAGQVARAAELAHVPGASRFVFERGLRERLDVGREVPAEDDAERPQVPCEVRREVAREDRQERGTGEHREEDVVLRELTQPLPQHGSELAAELLGRHLPAHDALELEVVQRHAPLEEHRETHRDRRLDQVQWVPPLRREEAQEAVADVSIASLDVRERVMQVVVRVAPGLAFARVVPLVRVAAQRRLVHPVVLAVHDVVAELHVVDDLAEREEAGTGEPRGRQPAEEEQGAAADLRVAHRRLHPADVLRLALAEARDHLAANLVELRSDRVELGGGERTMARASRKSGEGEFFFALGMHSDLLSLAARRLTDRG